MNKRKPKKKQPGWLLISFMGIQWGDPFPTREAAEAAAERFFGFRWKAQGARVRQEEI